MAQEKTNREKTAPQSADHKKLIATGRNDITYQIMGLIYRPMDDTLMQRGGASSHAYKLYDDIERDCHAFAVLQKRKMAVIARDWEIMPASEDARDVAASELVAGVVDAMDFDSLCLDLLDALLKGFAAVELVWEMADGTFAPLDAMPINQRRIVFDEDRRPRLLTRSNMIQGIEFPERKLIVHRVGAKDGNPYGLGLGTRLYWPTFFKRNGIAWWLVFVEKFASPTAVGKYPLGTSPAEQDAILASVCSISQQAGIVVPEGTEVSLLEALKGSGANSYEDLCRFMDEQISEAVLGETLSTNIRGGGSRAASETHNEVRQELTDADCDLLSGTLRKTLFQWIVDFNMPGARPPSITRKRPENESEINAVHAARATWMKDLKEIGFVPTLEEVQRRFGENFVPRPEPTVAPVQDSAFAEAEAGRADLAAQLEDYAAPLTDAWIDDIKALVERSQSFDEVEQGLLDLYAHRLPVDDLADVIARGLVLAELSGMAEVKEDA